MNKSQKVRNLFEKNPNMSVSEIAEEVGIRYAFAYQVLRRHVDKNDNLEMPTKNSENSKADTIREMFDKGLTIGEIAKKLNTNYSYCWQVCDKHRKEDNNDSE